MADLTLSATVLIVLYMLVGVDDRNQDVFLFRVREVKFTPWLVDRK